MREKHLRHSSHNYMSREIKYRVWDKKDKRYVVNVIVDYSGCLWWDLGGNLSVIDDVERYEIQLSTNLKDKNGKEIYESDILERNGYRKLVEWTGGDDTDWQGYDLENVFDKWEIIGKLFENPELLENK